MKKAIISGFFLCSVLVSFAAFHLAGYFKLDRKNVIYVNSKKSLNDLEIDEILGSKMYGDKPREFDKCYEEDYKIRRIYLRKFLTWEIKSDTIDRQLVTTKKD